METPKLPEGQNSLLATPQPVEIVVAENGGSPLAFVLPPFDDIEEIEGLRGLNFSLREFTEFERQEFQSLFSEEFERLNNRRDQYRTSPVFVSRLATVAHFAGRRTEERRLLKEATDLSDEVFYAHRLGEALLMAGDTDEAERLFESLNLNADLNANLRLAYFCVQRKDFARAKGFVHTALDIDPLNYGALLFDGGLRLIGREYERAVRSFRQALKDRASSAVAYCNLAIAYMGLREPTKALGSLKKAVALDPLNLNALVLLSDVSFNLGKDEEALPSLRYYLQLEQKNSVAWSRLARAALRIGRIDESVEALKRQASLEDSGSVWSNLGVAYQLKGLTRRAIECYSHAINLETKVRGKNFILPFRNLLQVLLSQEEFQKVIELTPTVLESGDIQLILSDDQLSDIVPMYVHALYKVNRPETASEVARRYLNEGPIAERLSLWLVATLVSRQALRGHFDDVGRLVRDEDAKITKFDSNLATASESYFNNVAFALAEQGDLDGAEKYFVKIANLVHKSAYPTATSGLINFRKGRIKRAVELYEEAVALAPKRNDKRRIRQKLNLELGKYYVGQNERKAVRWLEKVIAARDGEPELSRQASAVVRQLRGLGKASE